MPKSRKHTKFDDVSNWLDKVHKEVNTGVSMTLKYLKKLEDKFNEEEGEKFEECEEDEEENN